jgi:membrane protein CcdC involved in cytochrome C biogenesis
LTTRESNDILEILIFDNIFLKTLIIHFTKAFYEVFKKEDLNLKQTKLKNLYIIDLLTLNIMLDMTKIQGIKAKQRNKKFYKCKRCKL